MKARHMIPLGCAGLLMAAAAVSCSDHARASSASNGNPGATASASDNDTLTDASIAGIVITDNTADSTGGAYATTRARNSAVREFARRMVHDHGAANAQATALVRRLHMSVEDSKQSQDARQDAQKNLDDLGRASAQDFDKKYIDNEVKGHQDDLDALDHKLIPAAKDASLKNLLQQERAVVNSHLQQAKQIQSQLNR